MNFEFNLDGTVSAASIEQHQPRGKGRVPKGEKWKQDGERVSEYARLSFRANPDVKGFLEAQREPGETDQSLLTRMIGQLQRFLS